MGDTPARKKTLSKEESFTEKLPDARLANSKFADAVNESECEAADGTFRSSSDEFEKELDEFFEERANHRAQHFADPNMKNVAKERETREDVSALDPMSGCCQTGCHDCPWSYQPGGNS